jgi:hypothetical protein
LVTFVITYSMSLDILEEDVILYHGLEDDDFDDRVWLSDTEKLSTKIILTIK